MSAPRLRSGIFLAPFHAKADNPTLALERDMELLQHLDRLGYDEAWIGEHHSGGVEIIAAPEMFIAAAAERTKHIRLGTGVSSLPYHNPFMLASRMVQLDHMTRGRAMFGVGPGALVYDAFKIGVAASEQRRMMNESLEVIIPLLRGEMVNRKTDWFNLTQAQLQLRPYTQPTMELAVASARSPSGSLLAGIDADLQRVMDERPWADPEHGPAAGHVVELDHAVGKHERVVVGQRDDPGAEADVAGALGRGGDEHLGTGDQLEPARMVLADPGFVIVQPVEMLQQLHVTMEGEGGVLLHAVERCEEDAAAQIIGHVAGSRNRFLCQHNAFRR